MGIYAMRRERDSYKYYDLSTSKYSCGILWPRFKSSIIYVTMQADDLIVNDQYNLFILGSTYEGSAWKFWASIYTQKQ